MVNTRRMWGDELATLVNLREMRRDDLQRVMQIERECFPTPWHESAYMTELVNRSAYYIVAEIDEEIVGYAGMWVIMDEAHITTLGIAKSHRGMKIGEQVLVGLLDEAMRRGARRATLEVRQSNMVAQNLYKKYHFIPAAIRRGYYTDNQENALVMWIDDMKKPVFIESYRSLKDDLIATCSSSRREGVT